MATVCHGNTAYAAIAAIAVTIAAAAREDFRLKPRFTASTGPTKLTPAFVTTHARISKGYRATDLAWNMEHAMSAATAAKTGSATVTPNATDLGDCMRCA